MTRKPRYLSYLLRLWETSDGEERIWRASLESPGSGQRRGFASLKDLACFLEAQTEHQDEHGPEPDPSIGQGGGWTTNP